MVYVKIKEESNMKKTQYNTPKNSSKYAGEFIVFNTEEKNPRVRYSSPVAKEAYDKATEIQNKTGKNLVVERVPEGKNQSSYFFTE